MSLFTTFSKLFDEKTFYQTFLRDLDSCQSEVIIESPFITRIRMGTFDRIFQKLLKRDVKIYIITRDPREHEEFMDPQSEDAIRWCETVGYPSFALYRQSSSKTGDY